MKKRSGPDLNPRKPDTEKCPDCNRGFTQGVFHKMTCFRCNGVGRLKAGEALPESEAIVFLRMAYNHLQDQCRLLRLEISQLREGENGRGYGAGGSRYHGD